jgi:exodeoxyribonuclease V alpha subunit
LNPPSESRPSITRGKTVYRVGDKVMQLKNDYERNVWNGDVGVVLSVDTEEDALVVRFDEVPGSSEGRDVPYDAGALDELALAYACTIHKSQGSEYPAIVLPLLTTHFVMLSKNLLYTAVTRGKRLVVLVADPRALGLALKPPHASDAARVERRATKLCERLKEAGPRGPGLAGEGTAR